MGVGQVCGGEKIKREREREREKRMDVIKFGKII